MEKQTKNIYQKLLKIQSQVKGLSKDKQSHNYGYVTGNKLLSFIKPLMDAEGLILKQEILSIENTRQDYKTKYSEKSEILSKVMIRFTWINCETGEKDENLFGANGQNDWDKGVGSALTYAERYFLLKYFHIATDEDDIDNPDRKPEQKEPIKTVNHSKTELPYLEVDSKAWNGALKKGSELSVLRGYFRISKENSDKYEKELIEKELINSMT